MKTQNNQGQRHLCCTAGLEITKNLPKRGIKIGFSHILFFFLQHFPLSLMQLLVGGGTVVRASYGPVTHSCCHSNRLPHATRSQVNTDKSSNQLSNCSSERTIRMQDNYCGTARPHKHIFIYIQAQRLHIRCIVYASALWSEEKTLQQLLQIDQTLLIDNLTPRIIRAQSTALPFLTVIPCQKINLS